MTRPGGPRLRGADRGRVPRRGAARVSAARTCVEHRPGWCEAIVATLRWAWRHEGPAPLPVVSAAPVTARRLTVVTIAARGARGSRASPSSRSSRVAQLVGVGSAWSWSCQRVSWAARSCSASRSSSAAAGADLGQRPLRRCTRPARSRRRGARARRPRATGPARPRRPPGCRSRRLDGVVVGRPGRRRRDRGRRRRRCRRRGRPR